MEPISCPECGGRGTASFIACPRNGSGCRTGTLKCGECGGSGTISTERDEALKASRRRYEDRVKRGYSLREEAARLGIAPSTLADLEHGRSPK